MKRSFLQPALMGGLVGGTLSALPIVSAGNLCCCLWVVSAGVVAAYLLQQNQPAPVTPGDGAVAGLLAGLVAAVVYLVISIPVSLLVAPAERMVLQRLIERMGSMPPEFREYARNYRVAGLGIVLGFFMMLCFGVVFSTLGGVLGAVIFRKTASSADSSPAA